jgi:creatinine amidohydrolase
MKRAVVIAFLLAATALPAVAQSGEDEQIPFRRMDYYCWQEFQEVVPGRCDTVILPVGTQEAHGAIANGADALVPERLAEMVAPQANALIAPTIHYGYTTSLAGYPGSFAISRPTFRQYCMEVVEGLAQCGFRNIIILNGHGQNRTALNEVAAEVSPKSRVRILVVDWWSYCADLTKEVWGEDAEGGHAGLNENAAVHAVDPKLVRSKYFRESLAVPITDAYTAYPNPGSILLYVEGKGYPDFNREKAVLYLQRVSEELADLIVKTRTLWEETELYR